MDYTPQISPSSRLNLIRRTTPPVSVTFPSPLASIQRRSRFPRRRRTSRTFPRVVSKVATFQYLLHVLALLVHLVGSFPFVFSTLLHHLRKTVFALLSERFPTSSSPGEYLPSKLPISLLYLSHHRALSRQGPIGSCRRFRILSSAFVLLFWSKESAWYSCRVFRSRMSSKRCSRVRNDELPISRR